MTAHRANTYGLAETRAVTVASVKGGVGKTTTCLGLAAAFLAGADREVGLRARRPITPATRVERRRCIVVDADDLGSLTLDAEAQTSDRWVEWLDSGRLTIARLDDPATFGPDLDELLAAIPDDAPTLVLIDTPGHRQGVDGGALAEAARRADLGILVAAPMVREVTALGFLLAEGSGMVPWADVEDDPTADACPSVFLATRVPGGTLRADDVPSIAKGLGLPLLGAVPRAEAIPSAIEAGDLADAVTRRPRGPLSQLPGLGHGNVVAELLDALDGLVALGR